MARFCRQTSCPVQFACTRLRTEQIILVEQNRSALINLVASFIEHRISCLITLRISVDMQQCGNGRARKIGLVERVSIASLVAKKTGPPIGGRWESTSSRRCRVASTLTLNTRISGRRVGGSSIIPRSIERSKKSSRNDRRSEKRRGSSTTPMTTACSELVITMWPTSNDVACSLDQKKKACDPAGSFSLPTTRPMAPVRKSK